MTRRKTAASTATAAAKATPGQRAANDAELHPEPSAPSTPNGRVVGGTALPEPGFEDEVQDEDAFPDEEPPSSATQHDELAPAPIPIIDLMDALVTSLAPVVANTERLALQRTAFPSTAPKPPARAPAYRRITAELVKAETQLVRLERRRQDSADLHERTWRGKRLALIRSFPADVLVALQAMNVLDGAEIEESGD